MTIQKICTSCPGFDPTDPMNAGAPHGTCDRCLARQQQPAQAGRLAQLVCGLRGHDAVLHFEAARVSMRCTSCGHDTPGWPLTAGARRSA